MTDTGSTAVFNQRIQQTEDYLDSMVERGSDQDIFVSGYLHGHFSLSVAALELAGNTSLEALRDQVSHSLQKAYSAGELAEQDSRDVDAMWAHITGEIYALV